ncbi:hypothetical protein ACLB2K_049672 [Fragaria x ananassa]
MGDLMITVEAMQDIKSKVIGGDKKNSLFDQLVFVGAVASNKEEEIVFENSSSALEALRKLDALKIFCPRRDDDNGHSDPRVECTKLKMGTLESKKVRDFESKKPENTSKKKMKYSQPLASIQHQDLPEEFKRKIETMGGCSDEARLVIQKELYDSDLAPTASRFSMPRKQVLCPFLEKDEEEWLEIRGRELHITLIDPMVEEEDIFLTQWSYGYGRSKSYVLRTQWNYVAAKNGLKPKDVIQVWSFRNKTNNKLHLALVKRGDSDGAGSDSSSSTGSTIVDG